MRRETRPLIGLKHAIAESVLFRQLKVGLNVRGIHIVVLWIGRAGGGAPTGRTFMRILSGWTNGALCYWDELKVKLPLKGERKSAGVNGNANCWKQLTIFRPCNQEQSLVSFY
jgi:hypothetical protein